MGHCYVHFAFLFTLMLSVVSLYRCKCLEDTVLSEVTKDVLMQRFNAMANGKVQDWRYNC